MGALAVQEPPIPLDEEMRLGELRSLGILDTAPEERFDRFTRIARRLFDVPIALLSLVDEDRQWCKSSIGLKVAETPRAVSFCAHAILDQEIFVVPDATRDRRFADSPMVVDDPYVRFYAGCPLRAPTGANVGTLCIMDRAPRQPGSDELGMLRDLAAMLEREMAAGRLAIIDGLTGLSNRQGFMILAAYGLELCAREQIPATVIALDLDGFGLVNRDLGHSAGNRVLKAFASLMKATYRTSDIFARVEGDRFVALLIDTSEHQAERLMTRFTKALADHNAQADPGHQIRFSYGIVELDLDAHPSIEAMLAEGERRVREKKAAKR